MGRLTGTGLLVRGVERGEPFVANLRLQWLATMERVRSASTDLRPGSHPAPRGQGRHREPGRYRDVTVTSDFVSVGVNNTGHGTLIQLAEDGDGLERKRKIQQAFGGEADIEESKRVNPVVATETDPNVTTVVFVPHGFATWANGPRNSSNRSKMDLPGATKARRSKIYVSGRQRLFPMGSFRWADRQKNVRWFMDQVTEFRAFPRLKFIHFIATAMAPSPGECVEKV